MKPATPETDAAPESSRRGVTGFAGLTVGDLMTRHVHTAKPDDRLDDLHALMRIAGIRHLPVMAGGKLVGIVQYLFHRTFWTVGDYCYLQDLFVDPNHRGGGVGRALIAGVEKAAREAGASRVHWLTQESNKTARFLYDQVAERSGFIQYRKIF